MRLILPILALALILPEADLQAKPKGGGNPPPWAPAHGVRAKHRYHYYPGAQVYFDLDRKVYFSMVGGSWQLSAAIPAGIVLGTSISLSLDTPQPYKYHSSHVKTYPPGKFKKIVGGGGGGKKGKK